MRIERDEVVRRVAAFCQQWDMLPAGGTVLCAVSGGRDSMALLHILMVLSEQGGFQVAAAHFNHQLRPTADRDERFVQNWCQERGIRLVCGRGDAAALTGELGTGVEDAARTLRYRFLESAAGELGTARIASAHHRDDNAETVLLHLLRGAGLHGLCGIPPVRGMIIRPLLEISRAEIDGYVTRHQIPYVEDETNHEAICVRNRLRLEVLPLLEDISPGCAGRIAQAGSLLREEDTHLQREAESLLPDGELGEVILPVPVLDRQDAAVRRRLVRTMGQRLGVELSRSQVEAVLALGSGGYLDLSRDVCAVRRPHRLVLRRMEPLLPTLILRLGEQDWGPWRVRVRLSSERMEEGPETVVLGATSGPLSIGAWDGTGRLETGHGSRTVKRLFADRGIPVEQRREHPALYAGGRIAAVFGVATDWRLQPREGGECMVVSLLPAQDAPLVPDSG